MRGIRMGVGDVDEVPGGTWCARYQTGGDDGWRDGRQFHAGLVDGHERSERDATAEPSRNRIELSDSAWLEYGACDLHSKRSMGPLRMRGH